MCVCVSHVVRISALGCPNPESLYTPCSCGAPDHIWTTFYGLGAIFFLDFHFQEQGTFARLRKGTRQPPAKCEICCVRGCDRGFEVGRNTKSHIFLNFLNLGWMCANCSTNQIASGYDILADNSSGKICGRTTAFSICAMYPAPPFLWRWFLDQGFYTKEHFRSLNADNGILVLPGIADAAGDGGRERRIQPGKQH